MLTLRCAYHGARLAVALILSGLTFFTVCEAARADDTGTVISGCVASVDSHTLHTLFPMWSSFNCVERWGANSDPYVRQVPQPASDIEKGISTERERRWEQRCHPQIALDRYGVPRYLYSAPGCEYGAY